MDKEWSSELVSEIVTDYAHAHDIHTVLTFDEKGISTHPNHISVNRAAESLNDSQLQRCHLRTHNTLTKYSMFTQPLRKSDLSISSTFTEYVRSVGGMRRHKSQLVWFRMAYIVLSRYMWMNEFDCM